MRRGEKRALAIRSILIASALIVAGFGVAGLCENPAQNQEVVIADDFVPMSADGGVEAGEIYHSSLDWGTIREECPDAVGWVYIPDTDINFPIMGVTDKGSDYYLHHDRYGNESKIGEIYVDEDSKGLFTSKNTVLYGHHIAYGEPSMFRSIASYSDGLFAKKHMRCVIETPEVAYLCDLVAAEIVAGNTGANKPGLTEADEFADWWVDRIENACVLMNGDVPDQVLSLVTCSYHQSDNERTVAYFVPVAELPVG